MKKKRRTEKIDWHPDPKVRAMQAELQSWMEKNDLTHDTGWRTAEYHYGDELKKFDEPPCLVLTFGGDLNNVLWEYPPDVPDYQLYVKLHAEFDEIVDRHDFWYDFEDNVTACFMINVR